MNGQQQIAKLESLLDRIRRNAGRPRYATTAVPVASASIEDASPYSAAPVTARAEDTMPPAAAHRPPPPAAAEPQEAIAAFEVAPSVAFASQEVELTTAELETGPEVEEMDMMDEEIVELGASSEFDEPVPPSAPRPSAQAFAEPELDAPDLEPPVKTPPPESGRQVVAAVPLAAQSFHVEEADIGGKDVHARLEADMSGGPISRAPSGAPAMEQLGETVELIGADAPDAVLELAHVPEPAIEAADDLEMSLPNHGFDGGYQAGLAPPSGAGADLERHRHQGAPPAPVSSASVVSSVPGGPAVFERPPTDVVHVAETVLGASRAAPSTFVEVLDASLSLRA